MNHFSTRAAVATAALMTLSLNALADEVDKNYLAAWKMGFFSAVVEANLGKTICGENITSLRVRSVMSRYDDWIGNKPVVNYKKILELFEEEYPCKKPEPKPDAKTDAKTDAKADAKSDAKTEAKPDATSEKKAEVKSEAKTEAKTDAKGDSKSPAALEVQSAAPSASASAPGSNKPVETIKK